jgi:NADH/NAD ratio-sensing transcriptional regulator Rex
VRGLLNFAPVNLEVAEPAVQVSEDLAVRLEQLCFEMRNLPS